MNMMDWILIIALAANLSVIEIWDDKLITEILFIMKNNS